jgi:hypothetical protein
MYGVPPAGIESHGLVSVGRDGLHDAYLGAHDDGAADQSGREEVAGSPGRVGDGGRAIADAGASVRLVTEQ